MSLRNAALLSASSFVLVLAAPQFAMAQPADIQDSQATTVADVVVTAAGFEQDVRDAPATITIVRGEDLRNRAYTNITDALRDVPGVNIVGSGVEQGVSIRGMDPSLTLFLIDGRPLSGDDAFDLRRGSKVGGNNINLLPPLDAIERIEIIRGPASSLYGSNAIGGLVNIITRRVNNSWGGSVSAEYTLSDNDISEDGYRVSFLFNAPLLRDRLSLQLTGGYQSIEESRYTGDGSNPEYEQFNFGTKFSWLINDSNSMTFGNTFVQSERSRTAGRSLEPGVTPGETDNSESFKNGYFITHEGDYDSLLWRSYVNYDLSENKSSGIEYEILTLNTQATRFFSRHSLTGGLNYRTETLENGLVNDFAPGVVLDRYHAAAFLEDEWKLTDAFSLTLSGRYDNNENFGDHFSPKVYAVYRLRENLILKGGVTSGFRVPKLSEAAPDFGFTSGGGLRLGNPNLKPEESLNTEIGVFYELESLGLNTSLTFYRTDYTNKIARSGNLCSNQTVECVINGIVYPTRPGGYTTNVNLEEAESTGVEHTLEYKISSTLTYRHNYTYTETEFSAGAAEGVPLQDNPKNMFNASLHWNPIDKLTLWSRVNWRGETSGNQGSTRGNPSGVFDPNSVHDAYSVYDAGLNYDLTEDVRLNVGVYNLANELITTEEGFSSTLEGRRVVAGLTYRF